MDLRNIMRESKGKIVDYSWMEKGSDLVLRDLDINIKDDLEIEYSKKYIDTTKTPPLPPATTITDEMKLAADVEECVKFAKVCMHRGLMKKALVRALTSKYVPQIINAATPKIKNVIDKYEGVYGCIAIDLRGDSQYQKSVIAACKKSPYKRHIRYAIVDEDTLETSQHIEKKSFVTESYKAGTTDDFLNGSDQKTITKYFHNALGVYAVASVNEEYVDPEYYGDTMIELSALGDVSEEEVDAIKNDGCNMVEKLRKAFKRAYQNTQDKKKARENESIKAKSSDDFERKVADLDFDITGAQKNVDVDPNANIGEIEVKKANTLLDVDGRGYIPNGFDDMPDIELNAGNKMPDLEIDHRRSLEI